MSDVATLRAILAALPEAERRAAFKALSAADVAALRWHWPLIARADQLPPPPLHDPATGASKPWRNWAMVAGRGAGKTRSAAEWVRAGVETGRRRSIAIIGPTADTLRRDVVQGESGLLAIAPPWNLPCYEPSQRRLVWPTGAIAYLLSSEEPDRIRGVNLDAFWGDELTSWTQPDACWSNLQFALRITGPKGDAPQGVISTTPKRHKLLKAILSNPSTVITRATTYDNAANLDPSAIAALKAQYEGTTLGRQEMMAELLDELDGALWTRAMLDECRVDEAPPLKRIVIAIDPAGGSSKTSDETGIIAVGRAINGHCYVLRDASGRYSPNDWARRAVTLYKELEADCIVAESNFGGEMVASTLKASGSSVRVKLVHASRGKMIRAEPVVAQYEQNRVHHVGQFPALEDQLCGWAPLESSHSPDRLDALVWGVTELAARPPMRISPEAIAAASSMQRLFTTFTGF